MPETFFIAQFVGPILLAIGIGIFVSRDYYMKVYRHLESESTAVVIGGISALAAGIAVVSFHNVWSTFPEILVSLLGWLMVVKGVALAVFPKSVGTFGDMIAKQNIFSSAAVVAIILGGYLTWFAYLS